MRVYLPLLFLCSLLLCGCSPTQKQVPLFQLVLEEGEGYSCADHTVSVPRDGSVSFLVQCQSGYEIIGTDHPNSTLSPNPNGGTLITISEVRYSDVISLTVKKSDALVRYAANDGSSRIEERLVTPTHLRWNTALQLFHRQGHTLVAWNTAPDGSGISVGLGSRIQPEEGLTLYAQWSKWSDPSLFQWSSSGGKVTITKYLGSEAVISVPGELDGMPVHTIASHAFSEVDCDQVILPDSLDTLEDDAFNGCSLKSLTLFDNIRVITDRVFSGCDQLAVLHLNAAELPVYSGTYYDTFPDKYDRLLQLKDKDKIVLFAGSSVRFGYNSQALDEAFPEYQVVNMGVFAYTSAMPQMELILSCMKEGDILLHSPEFDSSQLQFCTSTDIESRFFNLIESNYDLLAQLDLRHYGAFFTPLQTYLTNKAPMEKRSYDLSPAQFDEDGNPVSVPSYNEYGDYVVYRPNSNSALPIYDTPVHYTVEAFPLESFIQPLNQMYQKFLEQGIQVYYTYSPRNRLALSDSSTPEARDKLDRYLRSHLCVPIITPLEDSLWSGVYLYGTDNHLSTEGAEIHTQRIIQALKQHCFDS